MNPLRCILLHGIPKTRPVSSVSTRTQYTKTGPRCVSAGVDFKYESCRLPSSLKYPPTHRTVNVVHIILCTTPKGCANIYIHTQVYKQGKSSGILPRTNQHSKTIQRTKKLSSHFCDRRREAGSILDQTEQRTARTARGMHERRQAMHPWYRVTQGGMGRDTRGNHHREQQATFPSMDKAGPTTSQQPTHQSTKTKNTKHVPISLATDKRTAHPPPAGALSFQVASKHNRASFLVAPKTRLEQAPNTHATHVLR